MSWILRTNDFKRAPIDGEISKPTKNELLKAGLKKLGFFWLLAVICLPFPGVHFILVPSFFIFGVYNFFLVQKNSTRLKAGNYVCPVCKTAHSVGTRFINVRDKWRCDQCGTQLVLLNENFAPKN